MFFLHILYWHIFIANDLQHVISASSIPLSCFCNKVHCSHSYRSVGTDIILFNFCKSSSPLILNVNWNLSHLNNNTAFKEVYNFAFQNFFNSRNILLLYALYSKTLKYWQLTCRKPPMMKYMPYPVAHAASQWYCRSLRYRDSRLISVKLKVKLPSPLLYPRYLVKWTRTSSHSPANSIATYCGLCHKLAR
jgi:hypothetical protein